MTNQATTPRLRSRVWFVGISALVLWGLSLFTPQPAAQEIDSGEVQPSTRDLNIECAQANLQLARVELQLAQEFNREMAELVKSVIHEDNSLRLLASKQLPPATIERLKSNVAVAQEQLRQAELDSQGGVEPVLLRYAEEKLRLAKVGLDATMAAQATSPVRRNLDVKRDS